jgi:hypothetical protein
MDMTLNQGQTREETELDIVLSHKDARQLFETLGGFVDMQSDESSIKFMLGLKRALGEWNAEHHGEDYA